MAVVARYLLQLLAGWNTPQSSASDASYNNDFDVQPKQEEESFLYLLRKLKGTTAGDDDDDDDAADDDDSNIVATAFSYIFLFFLIFGLSATVEIKNLKKQLQNKFAIATGVTMQFLIMPLLGFLAVISLQSQEGWTHEMGVALLVVTSSPGGSYSNWWCSLFNADLALSVAMTTVSSLLSMIMLPLNLFLYTFLAFGRSEEESVVEALDFGTIFLALGIVLFAIGSGLFAGYKFDTRSFHVLANKLGSLSGLLLVLFSIMMSSGADGAENSFYNQDWAFYVGVAFPCLVGICLANLIARSLRLAKPETVAIAIECCYQNTGIATSVAIAMYDDKEDRARAVAVPLFYGVVEAVSIGIYCVWAWKIGWTKAPKDEKLCVILANTYEGIDHDDEDIGDGETTNRRDGSVDDEEVDYDFSDSRPSEASTRFQDERPIEEMRSGAAAVPFWRRLFGGGGSSKKDETDETRGLSTKAKASMGQNAAATGKSSPPITPAQSRYLLETEGGQLNHRKAPAPTSPARSRSCTVETSVSSASGGAAHVVATPLRQDMVAPELGQSGSDTMGTLSSTSTWGELALPGAAPSTPKGGPEVPSTSVVPATREDQVASHPQPRVVTPDSHDKEDSLDKEDCGDYFL